MAATYGQDWDIKNLGNTCAKEERVFKDGEAIRSRLIYGEEGYEREDYTLEAWNDDLQGGALSYWTAVYHAPAEKDEKKLDPNDAEAMLRHYMEKGDESSRNIIYVLTLMLERKKLLNETGVHTRDDGVKVRMYEHKETGESFVIPDPELKLAEIEVIQLEVAAELGWMPPKGHPSLQKANETEAAASESEEKVEESTAALAEGEASEAAPDELEEGAESSENNPESHS